VEALEEGADRVLVGGAMEFERGHLRRGDVMIPVIDVARVVESLSRQQASVETPMGAGEGEG